MEKPILPGAAKSFPKPALSCQPGSLPAAADPAADFAGACPRDLANAHIEYLLRSADQPDPARERHAQMTRSLALEALDHVPCAVILVDRRMVILHCNVAAAAVLGSGGALARDGDRLRLPAPDHAALMQAVDAVCRGDATPSTVQMTQSQMTQSVGRTLRLRVRGCDPNLQNSGPLWDYGVATIIFTCEPVAEAAAAPDRVRLQFGLTAREAAVLQCLVAGATAADIGLRLGIKLSTTRSHLSRCREKTGARSLRDLIRLVLSLESRSLA